MSKTETPSEHTRCRLYHTGRCPRVIKWLGTGSGKGPGMIARKFQPSFRRHPGILYPVLPFRYSLINSFVFLCLCTRTYIWGFILPYLSPLFHASDDKTNWWIDAEILPVSGVTRRLLEIARSTKISTEQSGKAVALHYLMPGLHNRFGIKVLLLRRLFINISIPPFLNKNNLKYIETNN